MKVKVAYLKGGGREHGMHLPKTVSKQFSQLSHATLSRTGLSWALQNRVYPMNFSISLEEKGLMYLVLKCHGGQHGFILQLRLS